MRSLSKDAGADTCYDVITTWLNNCSETHAACQKAHLKVEKKLPTRVIEVNFGGEPRLIESDGKSGDWVALSYCWGSSRHYTTTTKNLVEHYGRICISDLPNTVQDAVIITRRLGYQYLWVDSLCIIQDSKEDWEIEALKMSKVYGDASLTLAAEAAEDSGIGIFASTNRNRHQIREYPLAVWTHFPKHNIEGRVNFRPAMKRLGQCKNPLSKRAWTLQEGLLSPRVLHFAEDQIYWRCLEEELVETSPEWYGRTERWEPSATATRGLHRLIESEKFSLAIWYDIVDDFAQRNLSYQKDRLVALSGVAKQAAKSMGLPPHSYKAGLWESDLYRGLLWSNQNSSSSRMCCVPQDEYVAPSWSWASISTTYMIQFGHTYIYGHLVNGARLIDEIADIQEVCTETVNHEPFGLVQRGFMKIVGPCFKTCQCNIPNGFLDCHEEALSFEESNEGLSYAEFGSDCPTAGIDEPKKRVLILRGSSGTEYLRRVYPEGLETNSTILLLQIATWQAVHHMARVWVLILRSTGGLNEYRRIGCSWFNITDDRLRHDWTEKEITIV